MMCEIVYFALASCVWFVVVCVLAVWIAVKYG
jgi:hypothetical protein